MREEEKEKEEENEREGKNKSEKRMGKEENKSEEESESKGKKERKNKRDIFIHGMYMYSDTRICTPKLVQYVHQLTLTNTVQAGGCTDKLTSVRISTLDESVIII